MNDVAFAQFLAIRTLNFVHHSTRDLKVKENKVIVSILFEVTLNFVHHSARDLKVKESKVIVSIFFEVTLDFVRLSA
jgi:hypothetical protein